MDQLAAHERRRSQQRFEIEVEPWGGVVLRWRGFTLLVDPTRAWLVIEGQVLTRLPVAQT